jgi:AraC family transcriptional regulator, regulatory protein of adaptative response / DNA-3-methyladenine glycosylase II
VRLILDGALDGGNEEDLARRLGVSSRHLRRLFLDHLGVTPDGLARSARVHFARRLLDDTDLTVTEVAFAAGFGSLRQFNRACQDIFRDSPRALRARRRKTDRLVADGGLLLRLGFLGPLDWEAMLGYFAAHAIPGVESVQGERYRRMIVVEGHPGVLELWPGGADHLVLCAHLPRWGELVHVVQRARRVAALDLCLDAARRELADDPLLAPLLQSQPGARPRGTWDAFETGVFATVAQDAPLDETKLLVGHLVERFGQRANGLEAMGLTHTFPSVSTLATADLRRVGLTPAKARAVRDFADKVATGAIMLDGSVALDRLVQSIASVDGIDESTAHYIALRLGEADAFPIDGWAPAEGASERWRPWRAVAAVHLWRADDAQQLTQRLVGAA